MNQACAVCGKPISSNRSILRGVGPGCARAERRAPYLFAAEELPRQPRPRADFMMTRGEDGTLLVGPGGPL